MAMSKQDFEVIAKFLNSLHRTATFMQKQPEEVDVAYGTGMMDACDSFVNEIIAHCRKSNPRFDAVRFTDAVRGTKSK